MLRYTHTVASYQCHSGHRSRWQFWLKILRLPRVTLNLVHRVLSAELLIIIGLIAISLTMFNTIMHSILAIPRRLQATCFYRIQMK